MWPNGFAPEEAKLYIRNERTIAAPIEIVWAWLVRATLWPSWNGVSKNVRIAGASTTLAKDATFRWTQMGLSLASDVPEFDPPKRIAWFARSPFLTAYHSWGLESVDGGTQIVTEETQRGFLPSFFGAVLRPRMLEGHDLWLARLERQSLTGEPPAV